MSNELKEALAEIRTGAERVGGSLHDLLYSIEAVQIHEDELDDLLEEVKSLKYKVENLNDENAELGEQLEVLKKNLPEAERELVLWRLQRK